MNNGKQAGILFVVTGASGAGKGTVMARLAERMPDFFQSVSATTRAPRAGERHGVHYYFLEKEAFEEKVARDEFLEYACYVGHYYGTPKKPVLDRLADGRDVFLEIEVQGALRVKENYPQAVMIFLVPPSFSVLRERLAKRGTEDSERIARRLETARIEYESAECFDYVVMNDSVEEAVWELQAVIKAEHCRCARRIEFLKVE